MNEKFEQRRRLLAAVTLAAIYGMSRFSVRELVAGAWHVLLAMLPQRRKVDVELLQARLKRCESCPIYFSRLETCGSPLADQPELGCYCHMPTKAAEPDASCWADENLDIKDIGWQTIPKHLSNPPPK